MNSTNHLHNTSTTSHIGSPARKDSMSDRAMRIIERASAYFFPMTPASAGGSPAQDR